MDKLLITNTITAQIGYICAARNPYGTITVVGPAFVNREVTLKATPFFPWGCDVEWRYCMDGSMTFETTNAPFSTNYLYDGSFELEWTASVEYNRSAFYATCSTNKTIKTGLVSLNMRGKYRRPF